MRYAELDAVKNWKKFESLNVNFFNRVLNLLPIYTLPKWLDLSCGHGQYMKMIKKLGFDVIGTEIDRNLINECNYRGLDVRYADLNKRLPFEDSSFDCILFKDVIEHLPNAFNIMGEINRVLKPNGYLVICTCDAERLGTRFWNNPEHLRPYTLQTLKYLVSQFGHEIKYAFKHKIYAKYLKELLCDRLKVEDLYGFLLNFVPADSYIVTISKRMKE